MNCAKRWTDWISTNDLSRSNSALMESANSSVKRSMTNRRQLALTGLSLTRWQLQVNKLTAANFANEVSAMIEMYPVKSV